MIKAIDINKSYGSLKVLRGVSLEIHRREIVAITGASGAGKTTLLQILGTLMAADSGDLTIDSQNLVGLGDSAISRFRNEKIGFVFQFHNLLGEFSALENVALPGYIGGRNRSEVDSKAKELLEILGLGERMEHKPGELSGGEQQRVAIARALINSPAVVFADEPSGNLDSTTREQIHKLFFELRDRFDITVVVVTHDESLAAMADRKIVMKDGVII
ncbi:MAG: ABC transporter ATP-binding protein [Rikenellaceae bacterium]